MLRTFPRGSFREALLALPPRDRDAWVDAELGLETPPEDDATLPRGCVPYLPCAVDAVVRAIDLARVTEDDVVVDVGSGAGRAALLVHALTSATVIGLEIQPALVRASRAAIARAQTDRVTIVEGEATALVETLTDATVFFLYCPFSGARLERLLDAIARHARAKTIRVCAVDVPLPPRPWLVATSDVAADVVVYASQ